MKFKVDNGPHVKDSDNTSRIMNRLMIALIPIICFSVYKNVSIIYRVDISILEALKPLFMILIAIFTSVITEFLYSLFILKKNKKDLKEYMKHSYAIFPGLFLALVIPLNTPLLLVSLGAFIATLIGKMIFGGFGHNIFNPALTGALLVTTAYGSFISGTSNLFELDTIGSATPLANLANFNYVGTFEQIVGKFGSIFNYIFGTIPGTLGETNKFLILIAFIFLVATKVIKWRIPVFYISTVFVITYIVSLTNDIGIWYPLFHILSGGLLFGAVFMATDPVTSPITPMGQVLYGIGLGILTTILRFLTPYPEGVLTSILFMNMTVSLFDKIGLKIRNSFIKKLIYITIFILLVISTGFIINKNLNKDDSSVKILNVIKSEDSYVYEMSSKAWGVITANVTIKDGVVISVDIVNSSSETKWSHIVSNDYINKIINGQDNLDSLDAISGVTITSDGLKEMVKKVIEDYGDKYER